MESKIYGVLDYNDCQIDVSKTERGAKKYATKNGYDKISYRIGYNVFVIAYKVKNIWKPYYN